MQKEKKKKRKNKQKGDKQNFYKGELEAASRIHIYPMT